MKKDLIVEEYRAFAETMAPEARTRIATICKAATDPDLGIDFLVCDLWPKYAHQFVPQKCHGNLDELEKWLIRLNERDLDVHHCTGKIGFWLFSGSWPSAILW